MAKNWILIGCKNWKNFKFKPVVALNVFFFIDDGFVDQGRFVIRQIK